MRKFVFILFISAFFFASCQVLSPAPPAETPVPATATAMPPTQLTVCLGYEPESLYIYNAVSLAAQDVMRAIYDGPFERSGNQVIPVILEKMPGFEDGSARFTPLGVNPGDLVVNTLGHLVALREGEQVFPTGCTDLSCAITYDGASPLQMDQETVIFNLKPGIAWSDGQALTAHDSVYSFNIAVDPLTPVNKKFTDQTASYLALDDLTVEWTSQPGVVTDSFENYFWSPLPEHAWGEYSPEALLQSDIVNHTPLSWGPYAVSEWSPGEVIRLAKNPYYFRSGEGYPYFDFVNFEILSSADAGDLGALADGHCDILSDTALDAAVLGAADLEGLGMTLISSASSRLEMLAFGIRPASYDDYYYPYGVDRPDIFGDVRTRQAFAHCLDRSGLVEKQMGGLAALSDSLLPSEWSEIQGVPLTHYNYDPDKGRALLEAAGWVDLDQNPETARTYAGNALIPFGEPLSVNLAVAESGLQGEIAAEIKSGLSACGVDVKVEHIPASQMYLPGPEGPVFGRAFDLALLPWDTGAEFMCEMFRSTEIPSDANDWLGEFTGGANFYGYINSQFDEECLKAHSAGLDESLKAGSTGWMLTALADELPFIPLFHFLNAALVSDRVCLTEPLENEPALFSRIETLRPDGPCGQ